MGREPVEKRHHGRTARPAVGIAGHGRHGQIATPAATGYGDASRIDQALARQVVGPGDHVFGVTAPKVKPAGKLPRPPVAGRAAIVGRQHRPAAADHVLHQRVPGDLGQPVGAAVDIDDSRWRFVARSGPVEQRRNERAVQAGIADLLWQGKGRYAQVRRQGVCQLAQRASRDVQLPQVAGMAGTVKD